MSFPTKIQLRRPPVRERRQESPGHTLQATALVHEAYVRLIGPRDGPQWNHRSHFYAAAAVMPPHVVTLHAVEHDKVPYLVMECVDGKSLSILTKFFRRGSRVRRKEE
jgi:hypothetical protein